MLEFSTSPNSSAMRLAGPIGVRLNAASSNTHAQFRFELFDVAPDGTSELISHGMILGSMHSRDETRSWRDQVGNPVRPFSHLRSERPIVPGELIEYEILLEPTLWTIESNHRLRLRISTQPPASDCPVFAILGGNVRTGCIVRPAIEDRLAGGVYSIVLGGPKPSLINIPLVPVGEFRASRAVASAMARVRLPIDW